MRLKAIRWKRDPYNAMDIMRDGPWSCYLKLGAKGAKVEHDGVYRWLIVWKDTA